MSKKNNSEQSFCPLCKKTRNLVVVNWLHFWKRCEYCLMKLPISKRDSKVLGNV